MNVKYSTLMNILKFNINRSSILTKSLLLLLLLFVVGRGEIWGFDTYYAKMTVGKSSGYSGSGTVYVSNTSTNNPTYGDGNTETSSGTSSSGGSQTFYLYAKANDNNLFLGWTNSSNGTSAESTNNPYQKSVNAGTDSDDNGTKSYNYYAIFAKAPSVKVTATAGTGGTVNVSNSSTAGTYGSSSELTQYADALAAQSKTFYLFANPNSGYAFNGWTGASVASSSSNNTTLAVNTPSNDGGTSTYTVTANFVPYWYYNVKAQAILSGGTAGGGNVYIGTSSTGSPSSASMTVSDNTKYAATQPSAVRLYVKATATSGYEFVGWSESPTATTGNTATTYYDVAYTQGAMPSNPTKTYYAVFKAPDPTAVSVLPNSLTLKQKESSTLTVTLTPTVAYRDIEYTSGNTDIAIVDANGKVTGVAKGKTTITIKAYNSAKTSYKTASVSVEVTDEVMQNKVGLNFNEGTTPNQIKNGSATVGQIVFDNFNIPEITLTVSNCLIMPGRDDSRTDPDGNVIVDFKGTLAKANKSVKLTGNQQVDCETFYFATYNTTNLNNGTLWAYSFTGWHITNTNTSSTIASIAGGNKVPGQTVFQPGDVITPEILKEYGILDSDGNVKAGATLNFEALWGKVVFVSDNQTVSNDNNNGNSYSKPRYSFIEATLNKVSSNNKDAYSAVMMITDYYSHDQAVARYENMAITYKSLQREVNSSGVVGSMKDGERKTFTSNGSTQRHNYSEWRVDNIKGTSSSNKSFYSDNIAYLETTARFTGRIGQLIRLTNKSSSYVVVINGGTSTGGETFNYEQSNDFSPRYFYFGRNADMDYPFYLAPSGERPDDSTKGDCYVTVTGGYMKRIAGTYYYGRVNTGNRYYYIYGDQSGNQEYDPKIDELFPSYDAVLTGKSQVLIDGSTKMNDVYGGGYAYTATVTGSVDLTIKNSIINGSVYGGGCFGSAQRPVTVKISNSTVKGNVYGSAKGATSVVVTQENVAHYTTKAENATDKYPYYGTGSATYKAPKYPVEAPNYTPSYDKNNYTVMAYKLVQFNVWGGDPTSSNINTAVDIYTFYLSMAEAHSTNIHIENSYIGTPEKANTSASGNVYGGGSIARVDGDADIEIINSTVYSSVFGGGDGVSTPAPVRICPKVSETSYTYTPPTPDAARSSSTTYSYQRPNPTDDPGYGEDYYWSNEQKVLDAGGIYKNGTERLIYSPNTTGWGDVLGNTSVTISGGSTVFGNVYGGGNAGVVQGTTNVQIGQ